MEIYKITMFFFNIHIIIRENTKRCFLQGSIAYVSQQAWIRSATVEANILFGQDRNETKYMNIIDATTLRVDLAMLEKGDQTEIGEKVNKHVSLKTNEWPLADNFHPGRVVVFLTCLSHPFCLYKCLRWIYNKFNTHLNEK